MFLVITTLHVLVPIFKLDTIALALLAVAILPWVIQFIHSLEVGNVKITTREVEGIAKQASLKPYEIPETDEARNRQQVLIGLAAEGHNDLALAGLRSDIETAVRAIVPDANYRPLMSAMRELEVLGVLPVSEMRALYELVRLCNRAVHGEPIEQGAAPPAIDLGLTLVEKLKAAQPESGFGFTA